MHVLVYTFSLSQRKEKALITPVRAHSIFRMGYIYLWHYVYQLLTSCVLPFYILAATEKVSTVVGEGYTRRETREA